MDENAVTSARATAVVKPFALVRAVTAVPTDIEERAVASEKPNG